MTQVGTSQAVQWLGLCLPMQGGMGLIPGQGAKIPHPLWPENQNIKIRNDMVTNSIKTLKKKKLEKRFERHSKHHTTHKRLVCFTVCNFYKIFKKKKAKHTLFLFTGSLYFDQRGFICLIQFRREI